MLHLTFNIYRQVGPVKVEEKIQTHTDVIEGLKRLYKDTIIPLEKACSFQMFHRYIFMYIYVFFKVLFYAFSLPLRDCDFDANPMVLLLGMHVLFDCYLVIILFGF